MSVLFSLDIKYQNITYFLDNHIPFSSIFQSERLRQRMSFISGRSNDNSSWSSAHKALGVYIFMYRFPSEVTYFWILIMQYFITKAKLSAEICKKPYRIYLGLSGVHFLRSKWLKIPYWKPSGFSFTLCVWCVDLDTSCFIASWDSASHLQGLRETP